MAIASWCEHEEFARFWTLFASLHFLFAWIEIPGDWSRHLCAALVLGFVETLGVVLIQNGRRFRYYSITCGYPYPQVVYEHFFGNLGRCENRGTAKYWHDKDDDNQGRCSKRWWGMPVREWKG